jgi:methyl-accepting chemotaxis protein
VAEEVRKLAEQSALATEQIGGLLAQVRLGIEHAVQTMDISSHQQRETGGGNRVVSIGRALASAHAELAGIEGRTAEVTSAVEEVVTAMQAINAAAEGALTASEDVSAASEETSAQVEELVANSQHIASMAEALREQVRQFEIDDADVAPFTRTNHVPGSYGRAA